MANATFDPCSTIGFFSLTSPEGTFRLLIEDCLGVSSMCTERMPDRVFGATGVKGTRKADVAATRARKVISGMKEGVP